MNRLDTLGTICIALILLGIGAVLGSLIHG